MPSLNSYLLSLASVASFALASPLEARKAGAFEIKQVTSGKTQRRNGPAALAKAYKKHNVAVPSSVKAAAKQQGSVVNFSPNDEDVEYLCEVTVGTTVMQLQFDTGSSDLWVFSNKLPSSRTKGHAVYKVSSSKQLAGQHFDIEYEDGDAAKGDVYADKVVVGPITATRQAVGAATSVTAGLASDTDNDGILGLAFSSANTVEPDQQLTFFDTVKNTLTKKVFCADLHYGEEGTYDFGFVNTTKYSGSLDFVPVESDEEWLFTVSGFAVGSTKTSKTFSGIADTGTSLLLVPSTVVKAYYAKVKGAKYSSSSGGWIFPCSATLPSFSVYINGKAHKVPGEYINYSPDSGSYCYGGIQVDGGDGTSIFGDIFLKSQYVVFDQTQSSPRLGFGQAV